MSHNKIPLNKELADRIGTLIGNVRKSADHLFATTHLRYLQASRRRSPIHPRSEYGNEHGDAREALRSHEQRGKCGGTDEADGRQQEPEHRSGGLVDGMN